MKPESLKWQKILWAVVLVAAIYVWFSIIIKKSNDEFGSFPYMIIGWWTAISTGIIAILLRLIKLIKSNESFIYILVGTFNLLIGLLDIYFLTEGSETEMKWILIGL